MKIGFIGDAFDPASQLFAAHLMETGATVVPIHSVRAQHELDELACGSAETFLANASDIIFVDLPVTLLLRRETNKETDLEWRRRMQLLAAVLEGNPSLNITLVALSADASKAMEPLVGRSISPLPAESVCRKSNARATFDSLEGSIQFGDDPSRTCDAHAFSWIRAREKAHIASPNPIDEHMVDLVNYANSITPSTSAPRGTEGLPVLLFIVVNGVGLGHLTRLLAIAQKLRQGAKAQVVFWCYSRAAGILEQHGFDVIQRMTWQHLDVDKSAWETWETADFANLFRDQVPAGVVYDGAAVPKSLTDALRMVGTPLVPLTWIRRAMWQHHTNPDYLKAAQHCDLVIEPEDLAGSLDAGPTTRQQLSHRGTADFVRVPVIGLLNRSDMLTRHQARRALGLPFRKRVCLVNLGGDAFGKSATIMQAIADTARQAKVELVVAQSPLASSADQLPLGCRPISVFPLGRYLAAFDGIISAAGYNSFHEMLALSDVPLMFIPTIHARLDDQNARAQYAIDQGWSLAFPPEGVSQQHQALSGFWKDVSRRAKRASPQTEQESAQITADLLAARMR